MKTILLVFVLFTTFLSMNRVVADVSDLNKLSAARVKMKNVDGKMLSIKDVKGPKGTLVVFSCNHCPWAKLWESRIVSLGNEYVTKGFGIIMVNSNDPAKNREDGYAIMQQRASAKSYAFPYVVDSTSDVARAFGASVTPEAYLFDSKGKLTYHGAIDDNAEIEEKVSRRYLKEALDAIMQKKAVRRKRTKAIGCSIKWRPKKSAGNKSSKKPI